MKSLQLLPLLSIGLVGCASVQSRVEIKAPAKKVSAVLYDFGKYPAWNPFIVKVDGKVQVGKTVKVTVKRPGTDPVTGDTLVMKTEPKHLVWKGSLSVPGLFSGVHEFQIEDLGPNRSAFANNEKMSGLLVPLLDMKATKAGFAAMNEALKKRAEKR